MSRQSWSVVQKDSLRQETPKWQVRPTHGKPTFHHHRTVIIRTIETEAREGNVPLWLLCWFFLWLSASTPIDMRGAWWCLLLVVATGVVGALGVSSRLPRTSAGQLAAAAAAQNKTIYELRNSRNVTLQATVGPPPGRGASSRVRWANTIFFFNFCQIFNFSFFF